MAFVRTKNINGYDYAYLVESRREGDTVRQIHIKYLGRADLYNEKIRKKIVERYESSGLSKLDSLLGSRVVKPEENVGGQGGLDVVGVEERLMDVIDGYIYREPTAVEMDIDFHGEFIEVQQPDGILDEPVEWQDELEIYPSGEEPLEVGDISPEGTMVYVEALVDDVSYSTNHGHAGTLDEAGDRHTLFVADDRPETDLVLDSVEWDDDLERWDITFVEA